MITFFNLTVIIGNCVIAIVRIYHAICFKLWRPKAMTKGDNDNDKPSVIIIIPLLREQRNIESLIASLSSLKFNGGDIVLFVTTQKENYEKKIDSKLLDQLADDILRKQSNSDILEKYGRISSFLSSLKLDKLKQIEDRDTILENLNSVYVAAPTTYELLNQQLHCISHDLKERLVLCNYPEINGMMADQINWGLQYAISKNIATEYLCVLTGDSYVRPDFLTAFRNECSKVSSRTGNLPKIVQAISLFGRNNNLLKGTILKKMILEGGGIYQSGFSIFNELVPMLITEADSIRKGKLKPNPYFTSVVIGHGCFIETRLFCEHNGFPTSGWCEDILLTTLYSASDIAIFPLDGELELNEVPYSIRSNLMQMSIWANTAVQVSLNPHLILHQFLDLRVSYKFLRYFIKRWILNLSWGLNPVFLYIFLIKGFYFPVAAILLNFVLIFAIGRSWNKLHQLHRRSYFLNFAGSLLFYLTIYPLAFYYGLSKYLISSWITFGKQKTERYG